MKLAIEYKKYLISRKNHKQKIFLKNRKILAVIISRDWYFQKSWILDLG